MVRESDLDPLQMGIMIDSPDTETLKLVGDQVSFLFNHSLDHEDILLLVGKDSIVFGPCLHSDTSLEVDLAFNSSQEVGEGRDLIGEGKSSY